MGLNEDAMNEAERLARESETRRAEEEARQWQAAETEGRKKVAEWFREMGVASPPAVRLMAKRTSEYNHDYGTSTAYHVAFGWHLEGHDFKAEYGGEHRNFSVMVRIRLDTADGDTAWRSAQYKFVLGEALLEEQGRKPERR